MNMKGGVGKTTVTLHLAGILSKYPLGTKSLRVLAVDYDPQFNLSQSLMPPESYFKWEGAGKTTLSILVEDETKLDPFTLQIPGKSNPPTCDEIIYNVHKSPSGILDLIPSTLDLMYVALGEANVQTKPIEERFRKFIEDAKSKYDLVLIDCHPAGSVFTQTSLKNSDHVIIPVMPQRYAVRGVGLMMEFINAKAIGGKSPTPHILFNNVPRDGYSAEVSEIRRQPALADLCLKKTLKRYKAYTEAEGGHGFVWHSSKPYSTEAFSSLVEVCKEVRERLGL